MRLPRSATSPMNGLSPDAVEDADIGEDRRSLAADRLAVPLRAGGRGIAHVVAPSCRSPMIGLLRVGGQRSLVR